MRRQQATTAIVFLGLLALLSQLLSFVCGADTCQFSALGDASLLPLRAPRATSAFVVGALLSLSGALLQLLLRNPLADPYVLGVSGGAAAGALIFGQWLPLVVMPLGLQFGALAGAVLATILLFLLSWRGLSGLAVQSGTPGTNLILTGVMISAGFGALITLLLSLSSDSTLRGTLFWLMGDLDTDSFPLVAIAILVLALFWSIRFAPQLNVLVHGESTAQLLGVPVRRLRIMLLLIASLSTAAAVAVAGAVGFVGLVVPHLLRLWVGNDQRILLPASVLAGGSALALADLAARTVAAPVQLPVGVITALVGVPLFLYLLHRGRS